ncbi:hypothetical protein HETIRDRAFT_166047 [Heterobasidion irregulare TC 32-1]|uniref:Uncharacterized protein n=1 Tax=Heterobasidion irregulare (strain TC 32-1) TaxID=747525 RepID=W4KL10_HETIT|nr:uncharacterized protein HETIRDRAFT_166047 [Heterobasidion irregulare TC 32-1]ETW86538.1 hypothetical protein HETIRDRAFT_166047 [Heterobasidion irregulare TC 32-1]
MSEPETFNLKRRKLASGNQPITWNISSTVRGDNGGDTMDSKGYVKTSNQAQSIGKIDLPDSASIDRPENFDNRNANPLSVSDADRCLLTQELSSEASVEPCYLLNQRLWSHGDLLTRLEWAWGMEYNSLDPTSESNKIYLRRDWLKSFDSERWLLLPTPEMAKKVSAHQDSFMRNLATQSSLPSIEMIYDGAETFEYRMLSLEDVELRSFNRIDRHDSTSGRSLPSKRTAADQQSTRHYPPFYTLPPLISRAKPHFVICDAAAKLYQRWTTGPDFAAKLRPHIRLGLHVTSLQDLLRPPAFLS